MSTTLAHTTVRQPEPQVAPVDRTTRWVALAASLISVVAYIYFLQKGVVLGYKDSVSHLQIAQRVVNSPTAGFAQLGGVWLPLPHLLMLPLIWLQPLFYSGFAGSIISMISYVVATVYLYKIVFGLTKARVPAIAGAAVFALNPNILYLQSTPMTELLLFATVAAMVYYAQQWIQTERYGYLFATAFAAALACLTRYEAWIITAVLSLVIFTVAFRRYGYGRAEGTVLGFGFLAWSAAAGWMGWNWLIMGSPFNFQNGEYAKPSLWQAAFDPSIGSWSMAAKTYWYAVRDDFGLPVVVATIIGITLLVVMRRKADIAPVLSIGILVPFFIYSIESGQRPMRVLQTSGDMYNLRFALVLALVAAVACGYIVSLLRDKLQTLGMIVAAALSVAVVIPGGTASIITYQEGVDDLSNSYAVESKQISQFLSGHYDGGKILAESFGNETILFDARVSLGNNIYEGSYQQWEPALVDPAGHDVAWIIMRRGSQPDKVFQALRNSPKLGDYVLVYSNDTYFVYERK